MLRDELKTAYGTFTNVDAAVLTQVPQNMKRYIYRVKVQNLFAGINTATLGVRENGALATTIIDTITFTLLNDIWDSGPIQEDSAPLYIINGNTTDAATSFMRAYCSAAGNVNVFVEYIDAPA